MVNTHVLLIGPIRPNINYIIYSINNIKSIIPNIKTHISYWKTNDDDKDLLKKHFDYVYENDEPSLELCVNNINRVPRQIYSEPFPFVRLINVYKTFVNMNIFFSKSLNNIQGTDVMIRMRTDNIIQVLNKRDLNILIHDEQLLNKNYAMVFRTDVWKGVCDWMCISNYDNIKKIWNYDDIMKDSTKYNNDIKSVYNPESIISKRLLEENMKVINVIDIVRLSICRDFNKSDNSMIKSLGNII
tara:strand:- start:319 stop:1047 length:729 start_codon:yes stop_codon:yes gene_type:complete